MRPTFIIPHFYAGYPSCRNPPNLSWFETGTKYASLHTQWRGSYVNSNQRKSINGLHLSSPTTWLLRYGKGHWHCCLHVGPLVPVVNVCKHKKESLVHTHTGSERVESFSINCTQQYASCTHVYTVMSIHICTFISEYYCWGWVSE